MQPYSNDLRERVFGAMREGASSLEAGERFGVSDSFARKLRLRFQRFGTLKPAPRTQGRKREFRPEHEQLLTGFIRERPDASNSELARALADKIGRLFSTQMISLALKRLGISRKKNSACQRAAPRRRSAGAAAMVRPRHSRAA
jgi:transposase